MPSAMRSYVVYTGRFGRPALPPGGGPAQVREESQSTWTRRFPTSARSRDAELKDVIRQLTEEETEISYRRRILHGKIDILRAELVNRLRKHHDGGETSRSPAMTCRG